MFRRAALLLFLVTAALPAAAATGAASFMQSLGQRAITVLRAPGRPIEQREADLQVILRDGFDLPFIGRFVLGRSAHAATPAELADFQAAFGDWVVATYAARLGGYAGESFTVLGERPAGEHDTMVSTSIGRPGGGQPIAVDWRLRPIGGAWRIIDVEVEHVSMAVTQRGEFASAIRQSGLPGLIASLQARTSKLPAMASR